MRYLCGAWRPFRFIFVGCESTVTAAAAIAVSGAATYNSVCILRLKWENTIVNKSCKANINIRNWPDRRAPQKSKPTSILYIDFPNSISFRSRHWLCGSCLFVCVCLPIMRLCQPATLGCYSAKFEQNCTRDNTGSSTDLIFWQHRCTEIGNVCQQHLVNALNGTHCFNQTNGTAVPIRRIITRTLASEEYY